MTWKYSKRGFKSNFAQWNMILQLLSAFASCHLYDNLLESKLQLEIPGVLRAFSQRCPRPRGLISCHTLGLKVSLPIRGLYFCAVSSSSSSVIVPYSTAWRITWCSATATFLTRSSWPRSLSEMDILREGRQTGSIARGRPSLRRRRPTLLTGLATLGYLALPASMEWCTSDVPMKDSTKKE